MYSFEQAYEPGDGHDQSESLDHVHDVEDVENALAITDESSPEWAAHVSKPSTNRAVDFPKIDEPKNMKVDLRPYQKQALGWMLQRD